MEFLKNIIVTGATGFIGSHFVNACLEKKWNVWSVSRKGTTTEILRPNFQSISQCNLQELTRKQSIDGIVHCAASYGRTEGNNYDLLEANVSLPLQLLDLCKNQGIPNFLYLDTCFSLEYPYLRNYTLSKKQMVQWGRLTAAESNVRFINLELQHPYGPNDRKGKFVPWIINQCLTADTIDLTEGSQEKDFIFVEDVANALICLIEKSNQISFGYRHYKCGSGTPTKIRDFVKLIHEISGSEAELNFGAIATRSGEPAISVADITSLSALGWKPEVSLHVGLMKTIAMHKQTRSS